MPTIEGNLMFVSQRAAQVSEVWVRAPRVRTHLEGVVTTGNDRFPVTGGEVSFTAVPGPAVLALISQGRAVDTIPILVGEAGTQTLRQVVSAAKVADDATQREIEKLAAQAVELIDASTENAKKAQDGATRAETAASNAKKSESSAATSASGAKSSASSASSSASKAATSEQNAARSASAAATSASQAAASDTSASSSASKAATAEQNAADSAKAAKVSETNAASSANEAATSATKSTDSATSAKTDADRAANIAGSTRWDGDRLIVNGRVSPPLTGPQGSVDPGTVYKLPKGSIIPEAYGVNRNPEWWLDWNGGSATLNIVSCENYGFGKSAPLSVEGAIPEAVRPSKDISAKAYCTSHPDEKDAIVTVQSDGTVRIDNTVLERRYSTVITWSIPTEVPGMSGPAGPKGDTGASRSADITDAVNDAGAPQFGGRLVKGRDRDGKIFYYNPPTEGRELANKGYVDTVVAAEKARTVGMVWMVETETQAQAKETSCQKGDFIQVAQTGNIYKVV